MEGDLLPLLVDTFTAWRYYRDTFHPGLICKLASQLADCDMMSNIQHSAVHTCAAKHHKSGGFVGADLHAAADP
jgi:hypothetical protein